MSRRSRKRRKHRNDCGCCNPWDCCNPCGGCECTEDYCCSDKLMQSQMGYQWLLLIYVFGTLQRENLLQCSLTQNNDRLLCAYIDQNCCINNELLGLVKDSQCCCRRTLERLLDNQDSMVLDMQCNV